MRRIRFALAANDVVPVALRVDLRGRGPAGAREPRACTAAATAAASTPTSSRYHHIGTASGWVDVDGERTELDDDWVSTRDHSWGVRYRSARPRPTSRPRPCPTDVADRRHVVAGPL